MPATGSLDRENFRDEFEIQDTPVSDDRLKNLAFNEEPVQVVISEDGNPNAEQVISLSVNGVRQFLRRGESTWIKRKFVETLARARPGAITTPEYIDASGARATKIVTTYGLSYPFRVLNDANPDGARWLESILKGG